MFRTASGGFINLDNVTLWQNSEKGGLLGYQSGDAARCILVEHPRDVADVLAILGGNARDVLEEAGITYQGKRTKA